MVSQFKKDVLVKSEKDLEDKSQQKILVNINFAKHDQEFSSRVMLTLKGIV